MAVDFGINTQIISDDALQSELNKINICLKNSGVDLSLDISSPGLGALLTTLIRSMEKSLIASYEPFIALVNVVVESLKAGVNAIPTFLEKITKVLSGITELLSGAPLSFIDFIVNKIIEPITENINIPFFSASALIEIILNFISGLSLDDIINDIKINSESWFSSGKIIIPQKIINKGNNAIKNAKKFIVECTDAFMRLLNLLILPINFAMKLIEKVLKTVSELATDLIKTIKSLFEIISNPVQWVIEFISDIIGDIVAQLGILFGNVKDNTEIFKEWIKKLIVILVGPESLNFDLDNWINKEVPENIKQNFLKIIGFIKVIKCFILWFISLINPQTLVNLFFGGKTDNIKMPPLKISSYTADIRTIITDKDSAKPNDVFVIGDTISFEHSVCGRLNATIYSLTNNSIVLTYDPTYSSNDGGKDDNSGGGKVEKS